MHALLHMHWCCLRGCLSLLEAYKLLLKRKQYCTRRLSPKSTAVVVVAVGDRLKYLFWLNHQKPNQLFLSLPWVLHREKGDLECVVAAIFYVAQETPSVFCFLLSKRRQEILSPNRAYNKNRNRSNDEDHHIHSKYSKWRLDHLFRIKHILPSANSINSGCNRRLSSQIAHYRRHPWWNGSLRETVFPFHWGRRP